MHHLIGCTIETLDHDGKVRTAPILAVSLSQTGAAMFLVEHANGLLDDVCAQSCRVVDQGWEWQTSEARRNETPQIDAPDGMVQATRWEPFALSSCEPRDDAWVLWRRMIRPVE